MCSQDKITYRSTPYNQIHQSISDCHEFWFKRSITCIHRVHASMTVFTYISITIIILCYITLNNKNSACPSATEGQAGMECDSPT